MPKKSRAKARAEAPETLKDVKGLAAAVVGWAIARPDVQGVCVFLSSQNPTHKPALLARARGDGWTMTRWFDPRSDAEFARRILDEAMGGEPG